MCAITFMTLRIFWVGQQTQLNHLTQGLGLVRDDISGSLSWCN
jgi:hypothetical protein